MCGCLCKCLSVRVSCRISCFETLQQHISGQHLCNMSGHALKSMVKGQETSTPRKQVKSGEDVYVDIYTCAHTHTYRWQFHIHRVIQAAPCWPKQWLLCHTAPCSRHVCAVTQLTCLLCDTANLSAMPQSRQVCCATQWTCLLCDTANTSAVSHSRHLCCVTQHTSLLSHTANMFAVSDSISLVYSAVAILIRLAVCAFLNPCRLSLESLLCISGGMDPPAVGQKGALFLIYLQAYKWETAIWASLCIHEH